MIYNSWNIVYRVIFDGDNQNLQEDFDEREDAMEYALKNIADKPTVLGTEVFVDEGGAIVDESEPEVIFSYKDEEEQEFDTPAEPTVAELDDTIEHLDVDNPFKMNIPELSTEKRRTDTEILAANLAKVIDEWEWEMNKAIPDPVATPTPVDTAPVEVEQEPEEPETEDTPIFAPFDTDFTDVSADEAKYSDLINNSMDPTEFLKDLAAQLGIADQVKIVPTETPEVSKDEIGIFDIPEMPEVEPTEIVDDDDVEYPDPVEEVETAVKIGDIDWDSFNEEAECEDCDDENCHCEDGVCACDDDASKALEEVFDGGREDVIFLNCDWCGKQYMKEELQPEEGVGFLCPTCAEALHPQSKKTKLSESQSQEIGNTYKKLSAYYGVDLDDLVYGPEGFMQTKYPNGFGTPADIIYIEDKWTEFEQWLKDTRGIDFEAIRQLKESRSFPMTEADGGLANGMTVEDIAELHKVTVEEIEAQVKLGVDIEQEHTSDPEKAKLIALDHLVEFPDYYTRLVAMEKEAAAEVASPVEEYYDQKDHTIPSTQELKGIDNAVVPCKAADVVTHSEDEKPVDCKGEKPPLTKPLTEEEDDMDDLELAAKLEEVRQQRLKLKK